MPVPSESVWFEQVDTALINYIKGIVKFPNSSGVPTPVPVKVRKPDEDFKIEEYPCITLYNLYSVRDEERYFPDSVVVERDLERNRLVEEKSAIPYSLFYQIDFWSRQQSQMNDMTRMWLGHHPDRCFNLPVKDLSGNDRDSFVLMTDDLLKLPMAIRIARKTKRIVFENIFIALFVKLLVLLIATFTVGIPLMWEAIFADVGVCVIAILNSLRAANINYNSFFKSIYSKEGK